MAILFKVTNENENHHGFQYQAGLNVLPEKFNSDPNDVYGPGGFYFSTKRYIHYFYDYGTNLRVVELPFDDADFRIVQDPTGVKYRANKIIFKEKYSLDDLSIYQKFGIRLPTLEQAVRVGLNNVFNYLLKMHSGFHEDVDASGVNIDDAFDVDIESALNAAIKVNNMEAFNRLIDQVSTDRKNKSILKSIKYQNFDMAKILINMGAKINIGRDLTPKYQRILKKPDAAKFLESMDINLCFS